MRISIVLEKGEDMQKSEEIIAEGPCIVTAENFMPHVGKIVRYCFDTSVKGGKTTHTNDYKVLDAAKGIILRSMVQGVDKYFLNGSPHFLHHGHRYVIGGAD